MVRLVFDTSVLLAHSNDEARADEVEKWLERLRDGDVTGLISAATVAEFIEHITRAHDKKTAINSLEYLKQTGLVVMEVTEEIARLAGPAKVMHPALSTADALIVTTAHVQDATLFTFDKGFWGVGGVDVIGIDK